MIVIRRVTRARRGSPTRSASATSSRRVRGEEQGRDRRADRRVRPDEDEPRAGDENAGRQLNARRSVARRRITESTRQVRDPERARQGRDGRRLQGARPAHRAHGRDQDGPQGPARRRTSPRSSWRAFATRRRRPAGCTHPNIVGIYEYGEDGRRRLHRDGVRRGHRPARVPEPQGAASSCTERRRDHDAAARRAGLRARAAASCTATSSPRT